MGTRNYDWATKKEGQLVEFSKTCGGQYLLMIIDFTKFMNHRTTFIKAV